MILGQPFTQARRKQKPLFRKVRTVALAHDPLCTTAVPVPPAQSLLSTVGLSQTHLTSPTDYFSDTLLVDDLNIDAIARMTDRRFQPALVVETSPGNFQAWASHGRVLSDHTFSTQVAKELARRFGGDP